jgi:hypothetical protein
MDTREGAMKLRKIPLELIYVDANFSFDFYVLCFLWRACSTHSTGVGISSPSSPRMRGEEGAYGGTNSPQSEFTRGGSNMINWRAAVVRYYSTFLFIF